VVIVEDGTAEMDEPSHDATLRQFAVRWGRVWTTDETLGHLRDLQSQAAIGTSAQRAAAVGVR
jgi:isochorismate hydrolase